jgi:hypothetical protein
MILQADGSEFIEADQEDSSLYIVFSSKDRAEFTICLQNG